MSNYKLIAIDVDGTLLNDKKEIDIETKESINSAIQNNKEVVICTGRCYPELIDILNKLPKIRYVIGTSGTWIFDTYAKKDIYAIPIDIEIVKEIFRRIEHKDVLIHLLNKESVIQSNKLHNMEKYQMGVYQKMFEKIAIETPDIKEYFYKNLPLLTKFNIYHRSVEDREDTRNLLKDLDLELTNSERTSLECTAKGISKGTGLKMLAKFLNIEMKDIIAIGDSDNDVSMLKVAGLSVAMGNAKENIKVLCKKIVSDNNDNGVAKAINGYLLF